MLTSWGSRVSSDNPVWTGYKMYILVLLIFGVQSWTGSQIKMSIQQGIIISWLLCKTGSGLHSASGTPPLNNWQSILPPRHLSLDGNRHEIQTDKYRRELFVTIISGFCGSCIITRRLNLNFLSANSWEKIKHAQTRFMLEFAEFISFFYLVPLDRLRNN